MDHELQFIVYDRAREQGRIPWAGKRLVIGRRADADIRVNEPTMSGLHAEIVPVDGGVRLRDLDSLNGTQLNGVRIVEAALQPGDQVQIGRARIVFAGPSYEAESPSPSVPKSRGGKDSVFGETFGPGSQTVKLRLDQLRVSKSEEIEEDRRILLLRDLFEALKSAERADDVLEQTRHVLGEAFSRARIFMLTRGGRPLAAGGRGAARETDPLDTDPLDATGAGADDDVWADRLATDVRARPPSLTFVDETVQSASAVLSSSLLDDHRFSASESARISGISTAMAVPLSQEGQTVAVIYVDRLGLPPFTLQDLHLLGIAANHVSAVLDNVARIAALQQTNLELTEARENLAQLNRNLEQLVEERTAEIRRQADEIQRLAESKDELLGIAAHDIRGPLTVIQGTTELLRLRAGQIDEETLGRSLDLVNEAARGLSRLLSELLDAKAIESGKITLDRRVVAVQSMLESSLAVPRLAAEDKQIALEVEVDDDLQGFADPRRLGQAVTNLVLNAVKFSESRSRIILRARENDAGRLAIEVEDQGPGIAEADLERIFGTFEQGDAGRRFGGSGLGLMIARRLVDLHDGELSVESEVGVGSRFVITLPAVRDAAPAPAG